MRKQLYYIRREIKDEKESIIFIPFGKKIRRTKGVIMNEENKIYIGNIDYEVTEEELQRDLGLQHLRMMSKSKKR
jgi:RNA recognition motif-containing protein